jgi:uncharacterized protein
MHVSDIYRYPVKSLAGERLQRAKFTPGGFWGDRRWLVVDSEYVRPSSRKDTRLATLGASSNADDSIQLVAKDLPPIRVPDPWAASGRDVMIADRSPGLLAARDAGSEAADWLSTALGVTRRLVCLSEQDWVASKQSPLHIITLSSVEDLNMRLDAPVPFIRFRPNIVVSGALAYEEDDWSTLEAGGNPIVVTDLCDRCSVPNIDPETGQVASEPFKTLARYRRTGGIVPFGIYVRGPDTGVLEEGVALRVTMRADKIGSAGAP